MSAEKIINDLKNYKFSPVYWLEGEEDFFIDQVIHHAEHRILTESEAEFNLTVFYGRDSQWTDIINACRRYPMFSERQVVIIKEAQGMKEIEKLESYIEKPLSSTYLFIAYKNKKLDGRSKLAKRVKDKSVYFYSKKIAEYDLSGWTETMVRSKGFSISNKALMLLVDHIGNDLNRLNNEIDKLSLNLEGRKQITDDDIETYVGISKEFNVFELQKAIAMKDLYKAIRITQYFASNPKAVPLQLIFPSLYGFFSKSLAVHTLPSRDEKTVMASLGVGTYQAKDYLKTAMNFSAHELEKLLLLLYEYNLRNLGVNDAGTDDNDLLKEMIVKMIAA